MAIETTSTLALHVQQFYERTFLENLKRKLVFYDFTKQVSIPKGFGPTINFSRFTRMDKDSDTPATLSEGTVPTEVQLTAERVSATVTQYGGFVKLSDFILSTHISGYNPFVEQVLEELAYRAKDVIDAVVRNAFGAATGANITHAGGASNLTGFVASASGATANDVRKIVRALKKRFVPFYDGTHYIGIIGPGQSFDLQSETATGGWLDANKYTSIERIEKGELGKLYSVRFNESTNLSTLSQSGTVSECYFFGKDSVAVVDVTDVTKGDKMEMKHINLFIKEPGSAGSADPLNQIGTVGYKFNMAAKRLDDGKVQVYKVGESS